MKSLSREQEERIIKSAERVVDLVNQGHNPNDALYKVAMDESLKPEFVKRLTEVFNISRTLAHFKTASADSKADEFPLATASVVLDRMYPSSDTKEAAITSCHSTWFNAPPTFSLPTEKSASAPTQLESTANQDISFIVKRARGYVKSLEQSIDIARSDEEYHREMVRSHVMKAAEHFRSLDHTPFDVFETDLLTKHGAFIRPLINAVYEAAKCDERHEKRGSVSPTPRMFDDAAEPYASIETAISEARRYKDAAAERQNIESELSEFVNEFNNRMNTYSAAQREAPPFLFDGIKAAGMVPTVAGMTFIGDKLGNQLGGKKDPDQFEREVQQIIDPDQETKLRAIRMQALLNDLMTNDPVISAYDADEVAQAYNEISQMTPRVSEQPGMLRGLLARRLEMGRNEPFESAQIIDAEKGFRDISGERG